MNEPDPHWPRTTWPIHKRQTAQLVGAYVVIVGLWTGLGLLLTGPLENSALTRADERLAEWFEERRTPTWNTLSYVGSTLAETWVKVLVTSIVVIVLLRMWRRWFEVLVIAVSLIIEASAFLAVTLIVGRPRPGVSRLDESPVGSSFPSGHVAAGVAYAAMAVVVFWHTTNRVARTVSVSACVLIPILVGVSRMYRGMHFLTDVVGGAMLGAVCVAITVWILRRTPEADAALDRTSI